MAGVTWRPPLRRAVVLGEGSLAAERCCTEAEQDEDFPASTLSVGGTRIADGVRPTGREHAVQNDGAHRRFPAAPGIGAHAAGLR